MQILDVLKQLRDDMKAWTTLNINALNSKIDEKTIPIDNKLDSESTNPVQNKAIALEIDDINSRVGSSSVAYQISSAIARQPHFSGDYNDLTNAPNITEDDGGNVVIADEVGNIIFKADADGMHTTALTLNGEPAATEKYVDDAIANIDIPEVDFTGYATEKYVDDAIAEIPTPDVSGQINAHNTSEGSHEDIRESISNVSALVGTTSVSKQIEDAIAEIPETDLTNYYNKEEVDTAINTAKEELSESIVSESGELKVIDEAGNIIFSVDASGAHTTSLTLDGENAATEAYVNEAIANIDIPETDFTGYATEQWVENKNYLTEHQDISGKSDVGHKHVIADVTDLPDYATKGYVDTSVADLVNSAPEALNTLGELAAALEEHEDAYDALLETVGGKATFNDLENMKTELSESIVSEQQEFHVVDENGNIITSIDADGVATTTVTAQSIVVNGDNVEEHIDNTNIHVTATEKENWNSKSNFSGSYNDLTDKPAPTDLSNYYTKTETDVAIESAKDELKESIMFESEEWHIVDGNGNIVASIDASGINTTTVAAQNITINGLDIEELIQARVQAYIDQAILGGEW